MMLDSQPCLRTAPNKSDEAPEGCLGYVSGSTRPTATAARAESGGGFPSPVGPCATQRLDKEEAM
jgi:hypothetical protein